jgi:hypothetical protein
MASIPGSHYDIFAGGQPINFGVTNDPNNVPPPSAKPGVYNLEVIVNSSGTGGFSTAPGYQGLAILSTDGRTLTALHGSYDVTDAGNNDLIILGDGNESVLGATGDTLQGGSPYRGYNRRRQRRL